jgi:Holliday junction DNA helicase RuvA
MIARLTGKISRKEPARLILDVSGVGYLVNIPLSTFYKLGDEGGPVSLEIYTHVREDTLALYGFATALEKEIFEKLISITGIGPKLGLTILSGMPTDELIRAISEGNVEKLKSVPGLGPKTASRLVLELKDKLESLALQAAAGERPDLLLKKSLGEDAISALINLGYRRQNAEAAVRRALGSLGAETTLEDVIKRALTELLR